MARFRVPPLSPGHVLLLVGAFGLCAAVAGAVLATVTEDAWFDDLWFEVAKAGVQVVAVGVLGGALTAAWKRLASNQDDRRAARERMRAELVALVSLYNDVKSVRRTVRSLGLDSEPGPLTAAQSAGFHEQMVRLNTLQLGFESKMREFGQSDLLGTEGAKVVSLLHHVESHLNGVLDTWEEQGWTIREGTERRLVSDSLQPLMRKDQFRPGVSHPLKRITAIFNEQLFGEASEKTRRTLSELDD